MQRLAHDSMHELEIRKKIRIRPINKTQPLIHIQRHTMIYEYNTYICSYPKLYKIKQKCTYSQRQKIARKKSEVAYHKTTQGYVTVYIDSLDPPNTYIDLCYKIRKIFIFSFSPPYKLKCPSQIYSLLFILRKPLSMSGV